MGCTYTFMIKRPESRYKNDPSQQNPMQGKMVRFVENESEKENADGKAEHEGFPAPGR